MPGHHSEEGQSRSSLDVLLSAEAQWDLKLDDIIRIGVPHLWWYVATVYAIKLWNNIILATRTLHSFISVSVYNSFFTLCVLYRRAGCVPDRLVSRRVDFDWIFLGFQDGEEIRLVKTVETFDQKVGLNCVSGVVGAD